MDNKSTSKNYIRGIFATCLLIAAFNSGQLCLAGQPPKAPALELSTANANLNELEHLIGNARDIFERLEANRWKHLDKKLNSIVKIEQLLASVPHEKDMLYYKNIFGATNELERAIASQDRMAAMTSANKIMIFGARLAETQNSPVPINVAIIAYCGRKLAIMSEAGNVPEIANTVAKLHLSWQQLIPLVSANGGIKEVKRFAEIMKRLESANSPDEYGRLAALVIEQSDIIEKIFKKQ